MRTRRIIFAVLLACPFVFAAYNDYWRFVRSLYALELVETRFSSLADTSFNFIYASDSSSRITVSRYFNLDSLTSSCDGSSWTRSLAIAQFVSSNIPHDNQEVWPSDYSAIGLWRFAQSHPSGFNCRLHACLLHDLLLSAGMVDRITTCLPGDTADTRCHVVNHVWLPEFGKWAMIDSDARCWVSSVGDSVPLDVIGIREAFADGGALSPHPLMPESSFSADRYLAFLAQNFFWFSSREDCGLAADSSSNRAVCLVPPGYVGCAAKYYPVRVVTSSAAAFFAAPDL